MPEIERAEIIGDAPADAGPSRPAAAAQQLRSRLALALAPGGSGSAPSSRLVPILAGALALALVAVGVLGVLLLAERRGTAGERAAVETVAAWVRAIDAHDLDGVRRTTDPDARVLVVASSGPVDRPFRGRLLTAAGALSFSDEIALRIVGDPTAVSDRQVLMTTTLTCEDDVYTHQTVVTLRSDGDALKITSAVLVRAPDRTASSALG